MGIEVISRLFNEPEIQEFVFLTGRQTTGSQTRTKRRTET